VLQIDVGANERLKAGQELPLRGQLLEVIMLVIRILDGSGYDLSSYLFRFHLQDITEVTTGHYIVHGLPNSHIDAGQFLSPVEPGRYKIALPAVLFDLLVAKAGPFQCGFLLKRSQRRLSELCRLSS